MFGYEGSPVDPLRQLTANRDELFQEFLEHDGLEVPGIDDPWNVQVMKSYIAANTHAMSSLDDEQKDLFLRQEAKKWVELGNHRIRASMTTMEGEFWAHDTIQARDMFAGYVGYNQGFLVFLGDEDE